MAVAQLVERWIVVPVAEGSNPSSHPKHLAARVLNLRSPWLKAQIAVLFVFSSSALAAPATPKWVQELTAKWYGAIHAGDT